MNTTTTPDEYRFPQSTEAFGSETTPNVHYEQHDDVQAESERLTEEARQYAQTRHEVDATDIDQRRVEFGGNVIGATATPVEMSPEVSLTDISVLRHETALIDYYRQLELTGVASLSTPGTTQDEHAHAA